MSDRFIQVVFSNPAAGKEAEFNDWYDNVHIPELLAIPGMLSAKRFDLLDAEIYHVPGGYAPEHRYLTVYEMEGDVNAIMNKVVDSVARGELHMGDSLDLPSSRMSFWSQHGDEFRA
jgi:hypothetical protein